MSRLIDMVDVTPEREAHFGDIIDNLQLIADFAYGDIAFARRTRNGRLLVVADARPVTAIAPFASSRVGAMLQSDDEPEAYAALSCSTSVFGDAVRVSRGVRYSTAAFPVGDDDAAVIIRSVASQVTESPGAMEAAFMEAAERLIELLCRQPILDVATGAPFSTRRDAGDGVLRVGKTGLVEYVSPNAVNIMRLAGVDRFIPGTPAAELPGGGFGIAPVIGGFGGVRIDTEVAGRVLHYRSIGLDTCTLVLVADITEACRREAELKVKEATIREVHHRVKNNLQTIASLLRIQARRAGSDEARHALAEANERVASMAIVHDLLAGSDEERIDFAAAAETVVELVRQGLLGPDRRVKVTVEGSTGLVDAHQATSLALVMAELVHNAIEHGFQESATGSVQVVMHRVPGELVLTVRDDGAGLPQGFDVGSSANLGLEIVRTVVEDDLRGTLLYSSGRGTTVTVRIPQLDRD